MLVQAHLLSDLIGETVGEAYCENCRMSIGGLNWEELEFLVHEYSGSVLCFECEDIRPPKFKRLTKKEIEAGEGFFAPVISSTAKLLVYDMFISSDKRYLCRWYHRPEARYGEYQVWRITSDGWQLWRIGKGLSDIVKLSEVCGIEWLPCRVVR